MIILKLKKKKLLEIISIFSHFNEIKNTRFKVSFCVYWFLKSIFEILSFCLISIYFKEKVIYKMTERNRRRKKYLFFISKYIFKEINIWWWKSRFSKPTSRSRSTDPYTASFLLLNHTRASLNYCHHYLIVQSLLQNRKY